MSDILTPDELVTLVRGAFQPNTQDRQLAVLIDLPDERVPDHPQWRQRREMAAGWVRSLASRVADLGLEAVHLVLYRNARANNADLPPEAWYHGPGPLPATFAELTGEPVAMEQVLASHSILLLPTEFSATAPMKMAAPRLGFRAATMPGFNPAMIPALRLDYSVIGRRVDALKALLDDATGCDIQFNARGERCDLHLDLRHRSAHASGGVFPRNGLAGNLPSGEAYVVPYEGEVAGDPSRSAGVLPVQFGDDVVLYRVDQNRALEVVSHNPTSQREAARLAAEPAYGNLAELGLGVLAAFGVRPIGEVLLDEKLGLHIAFGRSEHFGGQVGPAQFSAPDQVVHIDRVYVSQLQPDVRVVRAVLTMRGGEELLLMEGEAYCVDLDGAQ